MPRTARRKSATGFYHVVARGIGHQVIFETQPDRDYFLAKFGALLADCEVELHAFALMDNHFHLLLNDPADELETFMRRLQTSYSMHYNSAYGHVGHVMQGRYLSEPVEDDAYYLAARRSLRF